MASTHTEHTTVGPVREVNDLRHDPRHPGSINVGQSERLISVISGGLLAFYGLKRGHWSGIITALLGGELLRRGLTGHCYLYQLLDISTFEESPSTIMPLPHNEGFQVKRAITIEKPVEDLYRLWRDVEVAPRYMRHIRAVHPTGERTSHWIGELPGGTRIEWDSEITEDVPNRLIVWQITGKALTGTAGQIVFTPVPHRKAAEVRLTMDFPLAVGAFGTSIGMLFAHGPEQEVRENLRRFKEFAETGEIATTEGQPTGARKFNGLHVLQPQQERQIQSSQSPQSSQQQPQQQKPPRPQQPQRREQRTTRGANI